MLIEAAFYKLPDYFQSIESPGELYESQLSFIFATAIFQELQIRGFSYLLPYIQVDRPYPEKQYRADIFVKIPKSKLPLEILYRWAASGVCEKNWIEVKFFGGAERKKGSEAKTRNLGKILEALLRLKFYVREGGKYLLMVFNRLPRYYLPLKEREYVECFLRNGRDTIMVDFSKEPKTVINCIRDKSLRDLVKKKNQVEFNLQKYSIEPIVTRGLLTPPKSEPPKRSRNGIWLVSEPQYYFYLLRILELENEEYRRGAEKP